MMSDWSMLVHHARGQGKTTVMAEAAKKAGAVLVCRNAQEAFRVCKTYGIKTACLSDDLRGTNGIVFFDPDAVGVMALNHAEELRKAEAALAKAREEVDELRVDIKAQEEANAILDRGLYRASEWRREAESRLAAQAGVVEDYRKRVLGELWARLPLEGLEYHQVVGIVQDSLTAAKGGDF